MAGVCFWFSAVLVRRVLPFLIVFLVLVYCVFVAVAVFVSVFVPVLIPVFVPILLLVLKLSFVRVVGHEKFSFFVNVVIIMLTKANIILEYFTVKKGL